jgi:hypothetical protein
MTRTISVRRTLVLLGLLASAWGFATTRAPADGKGNPGVLPVNSNPYGKSYGEWSARHWEWLFSMPVDAHPLFETADCSEGQSGQVWFLGGTFASIEIEPGVILGEAERDCDMPVGKALFFPLVDVECSTLEGNGETEEELRDCAEEIADFIDPDSLFLEIDGQPVGNLANFRVQSPLFVFGPLPDNNVFQFFGLVAPEGTMSPAVSDGVFVMLPPLPPGEHTLHYGGAIDLSGIGGPIFIQDITYHITVSP